MKYNIIPIQFVAENREAASADEAIVNFATQMDSDMNSYFKAVPSCETTSEIAKQIVGLIRSNQFSADEVSSIFGALTDQGEVLGGKLWTTADIGAVIVDEYCDGSFKVQVGWKDEIQNHLDTDIFSECDDAEWDAIRDAIKESGITLKVSDIEWDVDKEEFDCEAEYDAVTNNLPKSVDIPVSELTVDVETYLSDNYDYCVKSYSTEEVA